VAPTANARRIQATIALRRTYGDKAPAVITAATKVRHSSGRLIRLGRYMGNFVEGWGFDARTPTFYGGKDAKHARKLLRDALTWPGDKKAKKQSRARSRARTRTPRTKLTAKELAQRRKAARSGKRRRRQGRTRRR